MRFQRIKILVILLPLTLACTGITFLATSTPVVLTPTPAEILHFKSELVAFDYPSGTQLFTGSETDFPTYPLLQLGGQLSVGLAAPSWIGSDGTLYGSIGIFRHTLPPGSSLEQVMQTVYTAAFAEAPLPEEVPEQSGEMTIDDLPAIRRTYRVASGPYWFTLQDIWLEKDGSIMRISLWSKVDEEDFQEVADLFMGSLEIQDVLPPFTEQPTPVPTASPTPYPASLQLHYEDNFLAFDHPLGMVSLPHGEGPADCFPEIPFGGERLVGLGEPRFLVNGIYYRCIQITRLPMPTGSNLEAVLLDVYDQAEARYPQDPANLFSTGPVNVAGQTGLQWAYRMTAGEPTYELRDIWLQVNDQIYIISIWTEYTNDVDFWEFQSGAQALLNSLVIK